MLDIIKTILMPVIFAILIYGLYLLLSRYVFCKIRVNKWILLVVSIIICGISFVIPGTGETIDIIKIGVLGVAAIIFFWFFEIYKDGNPRIKKTAKKVVIKSKAKPNRVKNNKK